MLELGLKLNLYTPCSVKSVNASLFSSNYVFLANMSKVANILQEFLSNSLGAINPRIKTFTSNIFS